MKKNHRTILFFCFAIIFALLSVLVIYHSRGYRINFRERKITFTGGIFIKTSESNASIFLDGKFREQTDILSKRALVSNLLPGEYQVRVEKEGFEPWQKRLTVEPGLVAEARNILFIKKNREEELIATDSLGEYYVSPDEKRISFVTGTKELVILEIMETSVRRERKELDPQYEYRILSWSRDPERILLEQKHGEKNSLIVYDLHTKEIAPVPLPLPSIQNAQWYESEKIIVDYATRLTGIKTLALVESNTGKIEQTFLTDFAAYHVAHTIVYFIKQDSHTLWRYNSEENSSIQLSPYRIGSDEKEPDYTIKEHGSYIAVKENNTLYFLREQGEFEKLGDTIIDFHFSSSGKSLLFWTNNEIWVYFLEDIHVQPFRNKHEKILLTRFSENIEDAVWYPEDNEHVIFRTGNTVKVIELDERDSRNTVDLTTLTSQEDTAYIKYNSRDESLYFKQRGGLYRLKIR